MVDDNVQPEKTGVSRNSPMRDNTPGSSILFQNDDKTVYLIDIPTSLRVALNGNTAGLRVHRVPYSTPPLEVPYPTTEPKLIGSSQQLHSWLQAAEVDACLAKIRQHIGAQPWCSHRSFVRSSEVDSALKLKLIGDTDEVPTSWADSTPRMLSQGDGGPWWLFELQKRVVCNHHDSIGKLSLQGLGPSFYLPPHSKFLLSEINNENLMTFSMAALHLFPDISPVTSAGPGQFDLVVLDPPWRNKSVKRSSQFAVLNEDNDALQALSTIMDQHLATSSFVACWVTNSRSVWQSAQILFSQLHLDLIEKWVWLKVTSQGRPVVDPQSQWRKPYETLLIGKKSVSMVERESLDEFGEHARIRFIIGVPDLHSRKPNLKEIFEDLLFNNHKEYRALEIFARSLTAGWLAWGDEVLKFDNTKAWQNPFDTDSH